MIKFVLRIFKVLENGQAINSYRSEDMHFPICQTWGIKMAACSGPETDIYIWPKIRYLILNMPPHKSNFYLEKKFIDGIRLQFVNKQMK
jgi:hypothetical protein